MPDSLVASDEVMKSNLQSIELMRIFCGMSEHLKFLILTTEQWLKDAPPGYICVYES